MYKLPHELPNNLRYRKLGNFKKITEMFDFDGEYPAAQPKAKFWRFIVKNHKKSAVKHSLEKPILLNFVSFSKLLPKIVAFNKMFNSSASSFSGFSSNETAEEDCHNPPRESNNFLFELKEGATCYSLYLENKGNRFNTNFCSLLNILNFVDELQRW